MLVWLAPPSSAYRARRSLTPPSGRPLDADKLLSRDHCHQLIFKEQNLGRPNKISGGHPCSTLFPKLREQATDASHYSRLSSHYPRTIPNLPAYKTRQKTLDSFSTVARPADTLSGGLSCSMKFSRRGLARAGAAPCFGNGGQREVIQRQRREERFLRKSLAAFWPGQNDRDEREGTTMRCPPFS